MPSGAHMIFPESGLGLGHVTPTIFGSTVGYPSDSLASCFVLCVRVHFHWFNSSFSTGASICGEDGGGGQIPFSFAYPPPLPLP